jgi:hypothetical protein
MLRSLKSEMALIDGSSPSGLIVALGLKRISDGLRPRSPATQMTHFRHGQLEIVAPQIEPWHQYRWS